MAKLNKTLQDHFYISILLKPIGTTSEERVTYFKNLLNQHFNNFQLEIDEASEVITHLKDILKQRPTNINPYYKLKFNDDEGSTEWPELELLYKNQFVIGINDSQEEDINKIKDNLGKFRKQLGDQRRQQIAMFLLKADKATYYNISVDKSFIFIPDVMEQDLVSFLQMQMNKIVKNIVFYIGQEIKKLQNQDNEHIVFNKNQEKPQQRTLKKKKKGRCYKLIGDYCLMINSEDDALEYYKQGFQLLKRLDDYLWMMAIEQGKAAAYLLKYNKAAILQSSAQLAFQNLNSLNDCLIQAIQHIKKARLQPFIIESYFIAFYIFSSLDQKSVLQEWVFAFISEQLKFYVAEDQAIYLSQIGLIYKKLNMLRKCNYYYFLAAEIYLIKQPEIARMFLLEIKNNSPSIKQWKKLYSLVLKQLLKSDPNDAFQGYTYGELIDVCHSILPQAQLYTLIQKLNFSYFQKVNHQFQFIKLIKFNIHKPNIIPKLNRLIKIKKQGGFLIAPRKKQEQYKYEANQNILFDCEFLSQIKFPISMKISLITTPSIPTKTHSNLIETKSSFDFKEKFGDLGNYIINALKIQIWNYQYSLKLPKQIPIEVYEQHSHYQIEIDQHLIIEKSSQFQFQFTIKNTKPNIISHMVKMNISIYYSLQVGLQENIVLFNKEQLNAPFIHVTCKQSNNKTLVITEGKQTSRLEIELEKLRASRQYLKKVQITLEYIRTQTSKYQINIDRMVPIKFRQKVSFQILNIESKSKTKLLSENKNLPIWQKQFQMQVQVSKHQDDKKVYQIQLCDKESQLITKRILGDEYSFSEILKLKKASRQEQDIDKFLNQCSYINWKSITNEKQHGTVYLKTEGNYNKQLVKRSSKEIQISYFINQQQVTSGIISIKNQQQLTVKYKISSPNSFCHKVYFQSIQFKQTEMMGYIIEGKTKVKQNKEYQNIIQVQFCTSYNNKYVLVLQFNDQLYISEQIIDIEYQEKR